MASTGGPRSHATYQPNGRNGAISSLNSVLDAPGPVGDVLIQACLRTLERDIGKEGSLKMLRLVSKRVRKVVHMQSTMELEDAVPFTPAGAQLQFLPANVIPAASRGTPLNSSWPWPWPDRLWIKIPNPRCSKECSQATEAASLAKAATQVQALLRKYGPALAGVTHLVIDVPITINIDYIVNTDNRTTTTTQAVNTMLMPLASACPLLEQLFVKGWIGSDFLGLLGSRCPKLTHLKTCLERLPSLTVRQLTTLLPRLRSLAELTPVPRDQVVHTKFVFEGKDEDPSPFEEALCKALKTGPGLLHLDLGAMPLTKEIWDVLPVGLRSLCCLSSSPGPYSVKFPNRKKKFVLYPDSTKAPRGKNDWQSHMGLERIELTGRCAADSIATIEGLLAACPNVRSLHLGQSKVMEVQFSLLNGRYLQSINRRMDPIVQGSHHPVSITGQQTAVGTYKSCLKIGPANKIGLLFCVPKKAPYKSPYATADTMSTVLASISEEPLCHYTEVCFANDGARMTADLVYLPTVFPNVVELSVSCMDLSAPGIQALTQCAMLLRLVLRNVKSFSPTELELLCSKSQDALKCVVLQGCSKFVRLPGAERVERRKVAGRVSVSIEHQ